MREINDINNIKIGAPPIKEAKNEVKNHVRVATKQGAERRSKRLYFSEEALLNSIDWHFEDDNEYFIISAGDVDSLSFLKHVLRQQKLNYLLLSSWCFGVEDVELLKTWIEKGIIARADFYIGEIAKASYANCQQELSDAAQLSGGRCAVFRNHSKVMCCYGNLFDCVILSSGNVNANPRAESTVIVCSTEIADFYKSYFDKIKPFNGSPKGWGPWQNMKNG